MVGGFIVFMDIKYYTFLSKTIILNRNVCFNKTAKTVKYLLDTYPFHP